MVAMASVLAKHNVKCLFEERSYRPTHTYHICQSVISIVETGEVCLSFLIFCNFCNLFTKVTIYMVADGCHGKQISHI